jgi:hypothetical protein
VSEPLVVDVVSIIGYARATLVPVVVHRVWIPGTVWVQLSEKATLVCGDVTSNSGNTTTNGKRLWDDAYVVLIIGSVCVGFMPAAAVCSAMCSGVVQYGAVQSHQ